MLPDDEYDLSNRTFGRLSTKNPRGWGTALPVSRGAGGSTDLCHILEGFLSSFHTDFESLIILISPSNHLSSWSRGDLIASSKGFVSGARPLTDFAVHPVPLFVIWTYISTVTSCLGSFPGETIGSSEASRARSTIDSFNFFYAILGPVILDILE